MNKKLKDALKLFYDFFLYSPALPNEVDFDQEKYSNDLMKCVADKIDYTIEMYGTVPSPWDASKHEYKPDYIN